KTGFPPPSAIDRNINGLILRKAQDDTWRREQHVNGFIFLTRQNRMFCRKNSSESRLEVGARISELEVSFSTHAP
ncbi:MAG: hypothetical protein JSU90_04950, partial [Nitrospiraceae bacterium]